MTLFLPANSITGREAWNYVFGHNETHRALALDYGSVINHHDNFNTRAVDFPGFKDGIHFRVCRVFNMRIMLL